MSKPRAKSTRPQPTPRIDPSGEDPAVEAMLSDQYPAINQKQALEISLALQKLIEGQNSLLERQQRGEQLAAEQIQQLRERADKMDETVRRWEEDREKFISNAYDNANRIKATGDRKERMEARLASDFQTAVTNARAEMAVDNLRFAEQLEHMPMETIISPGVLETGVENGQQVQRLVPEVIRIKGRAWILAPGQPVSVPTIVAERVRQKRRSEQETEERKKLLSGNPERGNMILRWNDISKKYQSSTDLMR